MPPCWRGFVTRANKNSKEAQVTDLRYRRDSYDQIKTHCIVVPL